MGSIPRLETQESAVCGVDAVGFVAQEAKQTIAKDPSWEDMVILWATIPGYVANRLGNNLETLSLAVNITHGFQESYPRYLAH